MRNSSSIGLIESLKNLRANRSAGWNDSTKRQAPHKPFLLLSILDGIEQGWIPDNHVELSQELIETFFRYWNAIMGKDRPTTIALPFFHLQSSPFWTLNYKPDQKLFKSSPSIGGLHERIEYAVIVEDLFNKMKDPIGKLEIRKLLAETYFSEETSHRVKELAGFNLQAWEYENDLEEMVSTPFVAYWPDGKRKRLKEVQEQARKAGFSMSMRKQYNFTCAMCESRIVTPSGQVLVEGAHIIPWSESGNDDLRNGLSLCPSHHWMFDRMMITIRPDYTIWLSKWLERDGNYVEETIKLKNRELHLPNQQQFFPAEEALRYHNERFEEYHEKN